MTLHCYHGSLQKIISFTLGFAYNAPAETLIEVPYAVNSYQNLQFAWYHLGFGKSGLSLLAMNTGYEDPADQQIDYVQTFGGFYKFSSGKFTADASVYGQSGKRLDRDLSALYAGANLNYAISGTWKVGAGAEYLSGTDMDDTSGELHSFTPLFGTNHGLTVLWIISTLEIIRIQWGCLISSGS